MMLVKIMLVKYVCWWSTYVGDNNVGEVRMLMKDVGEVRMLMKDVGEVCMLVKTLSENFSWKVYDPSREYTILTGNIQ